MEYKVRVTDEYLEWFEGEKEKEKFQIGSRIKRIKDEGHFGTHKNLGDKVWELKWRNGRRVYYLIVTHKSSISLVMRRIRFRI